MGQNKIYIPTFISSIDYKAARVLPHVYFYNGTLPTDTWYIQDNSGSAHEQTAFPYFDNYQGNLPQTGSRSLLFFNETSVYGETPTGSLYSEYWETYVTLLYAPTTRLFNCDAIIPLADYFKMELNDVVEWRGNYYHLRAINDYNLSNGECNLQLLGPLLGDTIANILPGLPCNFDFSIESYTPVFTGSVITKCGTTSSLNVDFVSDYGLSVGNAFTASTGGDVVGCWYLSGSYTGSSPLSYTVTVVETYTNCAACNSAPPPIPSNWNYYNIDEYSCNLPWGPCSLSSTGLVGRTTSSVLLTNGYYYNNGTNDVVYKVNNSIASASIDIDLDGSATAGTNCHLTCQL